MKQFTFNKTERLKRRRYIDRLFAAGQSLAAYPIRLSYCIQKESELNEAEHQGKPLQAGVSVSKRSFKKAVDRNRIKRQLREAYRLQKLPLQNLVSEKQMHLHLFFIFTGKELPEYALLEQKMEKLLQKLLVELQKTAA